VPRGVFQVDPAAALVNVSGQPWYYQTTAQPILKGSAGLGYDAAQSRWVPAGPEVFSTDGSEYAWTERNQIGPLSRLHVTKVVDGSDRSWAVPVPKDPEFQGHGPLVPVPLAMTADGILLTYGWEGTYGVWRLDPASGSLTKVSGEPAPRGYGAGAVWLQPLRGSTPVGVEQSGDTLARLDPRSGAVEDWLHRDGVVVSYLGADRDGYPWVWAGTVYNFQVPQVSKIWRVRGPGEADLILDGQRISRIYADAHGTWFASDAGVYLFAANRLERVSAGPVGEVLGPCIA
jgi:hypothetical protein